MRFGRSAPHDKTDPLADVFNAEQTARQRVDAAKASAARWLEDAKADLARTTAATIEQLAAAAAHDEAAARATAAREAEAIVDRARVVAGRLAQIEDSDLEALVWRHLAAILPERHT